MLRPYGARRRWIYWAVTPAVVTTPADGLLVESSTPTFFDVGDGTYITWD